MYSFHLELQVKNMLNYNFVTYALTMFSQDILPSIFNRRTESYPLDTTFANSMCCRFMGSHGCPSWRCFLLAYKFRLGNGSNSTLLMLSLWCNPCSLPWIPSWPWLWEICSGDTTFWYACVFDIELCSLYNKMSIYPF